MTLTEEERFAIVKLFSGQEDFCSEVMKNLNNLEVLARNQTIVGYFSTIKFLVPLKNNPLQLQWDWNFNHKKLKYGGSFIASFESPDIIELEAIANMDVWPGLFLESDFSEYID